METEIRDRLREWASVPSINFPRLSPRREHVGFVWDPDGRVELYVVDIRGGPPVQVTHGDLPKSPDRFAWAPDDRSVVFSRDRDGNELHDLFRIDCATGSVTGLTHDPTCQRIAVSFSPDGRWLLYVSDQGLPGEERQLDLWRIPSNGGEAERVAHHRQPVNMWASRYPFSPDGTRVAYAASDQDDPRDAEVFLTRPGLVGSERVLSVKKGSKEIPVTWSPDGRSVAVQSDAGEFVRAGLLDIASHQARWLGPGTADESPVDFSPDGRSLLVVRSRGVRAQPVVYDLATGAERVLPVHLDFWGEVGFLPDGQRVLAVRNNSDRPNSIVTWDPAGGTIDEVLPPKYGPISPSEVVPSEVIRYPSFDGREIEAILYRPRARTGSGPAPALVEVHGGPTWQFFDAFDCLTQYLVSLGFVVLQPNVRGSTGYGSVFRDLNLQDLGGGDLKDVAAAAEYLRRQPSVDPHRLGIYGVSYGGYLTYAALTGNPDLWAAGVAIAGVTDWKLCFEEEMPDLRHYDLELMGDPVENAPLWHDRSPVYFAHHLRAPILMIHGLHDPRCPVNQARVFRDALLRLGRKEGRDFEYLEFSDQGHGSADREQVLRSFRPAFAFLQRHLLDRPR
ncbi:MAG TPA: S9 family peptidase [Thermoplasmata archaeon]|jgi:dipeptidyl aminopeptidase/acylaminoacyl peptidase